MDLNFPELAKAMFLQMPFLQKLGLKIARVEKGKVRVELPFDTSNTNHLGTIHAGALYTLAETAGGLVITSAATSADVVGVAKSGFIKYKKPARGMIYVEEEVDPAWVAEKFDQALNEGKADIPYTVHVRDENGDVVAEVEFVYHIRKRS